MGGSEVSRRVAWSEGWVRGVYERAWFADVLRDVDLDEHMRFVAPHFSGRYPFRAFGRHGMLPD